MNGKEAESIESMRNLCRLAGIDFSKFLVELEIELKNRVIGLLTPNNPWFLQGKTIKRYWEFLEKITMHKWKYEDVDYWYRFIRNPSETREDIPLTLRYQVLIRDKSICQKCGRRAPDVELHIDHILSWDYGGSTVIDNLQTLCKECNLGKSYKCFEGGDKYVTRSQKRMR